MDPEAVTRLNDLVELMTDKTYGAQGPILAKRRYVYASYVDEVVCVIDAGGRKYVHSNHLYSPAALTDPSGTVIERYRYDAYGRRTVTNAAGVSRLASSYAFQRGFTGYYLDDESGLYYARARMYSPGLGRFVNRDPHRENDLQPRAMEGYQDGMSLYGGYFAPNGVDPTGENCCFIFVQSRVVALGLRHLRIVFACIPSYWGVAELIPPSGHPNGPRGAGRIPGSMVYISSPSMAPRGDVEHRTEAQYAFSDCKPCDCIKSVAAQFAGDASRPTQPGEYSLLPGPNSNTFVAAVLSQCGLPAGPFSATPGAGMGQDPDRYRDPPPNHNPPWQNRGRR